MNSTYCCLNASMRLVQFAFEDNTFIQIILIIHWATVRITLWSKRLLAASATLSLETVSWEPGELKGRSLNTINTYELAKAKYILHKMLAGSQILGTHSVSFMFLASERTVHLPVRHVMLTLLSMVHGPMGCLFYDLCEIMTSKSHLYFIVARIQKWSFAPKCCTHDTEVWGLALFLLCNCCWCSRVPVQMGTVPLFPPRVDSSKGSKLGGWIGPIGVICYQVHTMSLLRSLWQNWHHGSFGLLPCFWWKPHN